MRLVTEVFVPGIPVTKGSWEDTRNGARPAHAKELAVWTDVVRAAIVKDMDVRSELGAWVPTELHESALVMTRYYVHGGQSGPLWKKGDGDGDKLDRCVWDAITAAGAWQDDAQVTDWSGGRRYAIGRSPGAFIQVMALNLTDQIALEALARGQMGAAYERAMFGSQVAT